MATFSNIKGEESATVTFRVGTISVGRGSTTELQEIFCLGDPESSQGIARVSSVAPKSTDAGLIVRIAGGASTATDLAFRALLPSTASDNPVTATLVTASTGFPVNIVAQPSSGFPVNIVNGSLTLNDTNSLAGGQSSVAAAITFTHGFDDSASTVWKRIAGASATPSTGAFGLVVRQALQKLESTCRSTVGNNSTRETMVSSIASARVKVYAYTITSTAQAVNDVGFFSSNANLLWPITMQAMSSAMTGANLAVTPPAFLFASEAGSALTFGITGTTGTYKVGLSYFQEP